MPADTKVRYTSTTGGDDWTYTSAGIASTVTKIDYDDGVGGTADGIMIDGDSDDEIEIEVYGDNGDEVILLSCALYENELW